MLPLQVTDDCRLLPLLVQMVEVVGGLIAILKTPARMASVAACWQCRQKAASVWRNSSKAC